MKILWITNHFLPDIAQVLNKKKPLSGSWLVESSKILSLNKDVQLYIACPSNEDINYYNINGIGYYSFESNKKDFFVKPSKKFVKNCMKIVREIKPDIIHLHGSEFAYGTAFTLQDEIPVVLSIQGLISEISKKEYYFAGINLKKGFRLLYPNITIKYLPMYLKYWRNKYRAQAEINQIKQSYYIIGRTEWDQAHSYFINNKAKYYNIQEVIRSSFFNTNWNINKIVRNSLLCAGGFGNPLKGFHMILESVALLKLVIPDISVRVVGKDLRKYKFFYGYNKYLKDLIDDLDLWQHIEFLGGLSEEEMAIEFSKAHVYVMGSSIENSSNTLGEAITVGTPSVVSYVGGIPSLANDEQEVLFYRFGDTKQLAWKIKRILQDDTLAMFLSENSQERAKSQYNTQLISNSLYEQYIEIINDRSDLVKGG